MLCMTLHPLRCLQLCLPNALLPPTPVKQQQTSPCSEPFAFLVPLPAARSGPAARVAAAAVARPAIVPCVHCAVRCSAGALPLPLLLGLQRTAFPGADRGGALCAVLCTCRCRVCWLQLLSPGVCSAGFDVCASGSAAVLAFAVAAFVAGLLRAAAASCHCSVFRYAMLSSLDSCAFPCRCRCSCGLSAPFYWPHHWLC